MKKKFTKVHQAMVAIDLDTAIPEVLAESASYDELWTAVQAITTWNDRAARVLDHLYRQRLIKLLTARDSPKRQSEALRTLIDHLERVTHPSRAQQLNALDQPYASRWESFRDVLTSRLATLESHAPSQVMDRDHVEPILKIIAEAGTIRQQALQDQLKLKKANLTRILKIMEANLLIERRSVGREKVIGLGLAAENLPAVRQPESEGERGMTYFYQEAA